MDVFETFSIVFTNLVLEVFHCARDLEMGTPKNMALSFGAKTMWVVESQHSSIELGSV